MTTLEVTHTRRPWWGLGLVAITENFSLIPPPSATAEEIDKLAWELREVGANVRKT